MRLSRKTLVFTFAALFSLGTTAGCITVSGGIAPSNIPMEGRTYSVVGSGRAQRSWFGLDMGIIGFPLSAPPVSRTMQQLIRSKKGDALINIRYSTDKRVYFFFLTQHTLRIEADVVKFTGQAK